MNEATEKTSNQEMIEVMEKMLTNAIETDRSILKTLSPLNQAKTRGIIAGAQEGLTALGHIKKGSSDTAMKALSNKIGSSIYHLMTSEEKYKQSKNDMLKNEIAYYDNLVSSLQLLHDRISTLLDKSEE